MKNIKALLVVTAILVSSIIYAQPPAGGQQRGSQGPPPIPSEKQINKMVIELSKELSLTEEKASQISDLYVAHFNAIKEKTKSGRPNRSEMEALETAFEKKVKSLLTTKQQKQFTAFQKKNKPKQERQQPNR